MRTPIHVRVMAVVAAAGLSVADVARITGWRYVRAWRLLHGKTDLSADDMELLVQVLGASFDDLYREAA